MLLRSVIVALLAGAALGGCLGDAARFEIQLARREWRAEPAAAFLSEPDPIERLQQEVLEHNPELAEIRARVKSVLARARAAGRLPDLEFMFQVWNPPIRRPYAWNEADNIMFGLRQRFPLGGKLGAAEKEVLGEAQVMLQELRRKEQELLAMATQAYAQGVRAQTERGLHLDHVRVSERMVAVVRVRQESGQATQAELLRMLVELSRLHADISHIDQERQTARARLNTLLGRPPGTELDFPVRKVARRALASLEVLTARQAASEPGLAAAAQAIERERARVRAARKMALLPDLFVGADYWLNPSQRDGYALMLGINLPWLNPANRDRVEEAQQSLAASQAGQRAAALRAGYELHDALATVEAAERLLAVLEDQLLPRALQSFEAAQASYVAGRADINTLLDAKRMAFQVQVDIARAEGHYRESLANLRRAVGADVFADGAARSQP
jgi:outer membrane protein TolC